MHTNLYICKEIKKISKKSIIKFLKFLLLTLGGKRNLANEFNV